MEKIKNNLLTGAEGKPMLFDVHFISDKNKKPVIVYVHGFNGFKDWGGFDLIANHFAEHGYFFVKMNLTHNGTTPEHPEDFADLEVYSENNYTKELFDVGKMIDWVCDKNNQFANEINTDKIILLGHSRGGGISILKANEDVRIKALITWASVAECRTPWTNWPPEKMLQWKDDGVVYIENKRTKQQMPIRYQLYEDYINNKERLDIENAVKNLSIPIQMCHGTEDEAVPYDSFLRFQKWKPDADFVTVNSNHVFGRAHPYNESFIPEKCMEVIEKNILFLKSVGL